jgi:hypothetical protein
MSVLNNYLTIDFLCDRGATPLNCLRASEIGLTLANCIDVVRRNTHENEDSAGVEHFRSALDPG